MTKPITLEQFQALQREAADLRRRADRADGALVEKTKQLADEFGAKMIKDAEQLLPKLEKEAAVKEAEAAKALAAYREKWAGKLQ